MPLDFPCSGNLGAGDRANIALTSDLILHDGQIEEQGLDGCCNAETVQPRTTFVRSTKTKRRGQRRKDRERRVGKATNVIQTLSKTLLESLLLAEVRAFDKLSGLKETETVVKTCVNGHVKKESTVCRRDIAGWFHNADNEDNLDDLGVSHVQSGHGGFLMKRKNQTQFFLENIALQLASSNAMACNRLPVKILPDITVYVGSGSSAKNASVLADLNITHILNVSAVVPNYHADSGRFRYLKIPIYDDGSVNILDIFHSSNVFEFMKQGDTSNGGVLVHCCAGQSRSVAFVMGYLMWRYGMGVDQALECVRRVRPCAMPNEGFMEQLRRFTLMDN
jgi:protein-tyrosine phosphatase